MLRYLDRSSGTTSLLTAVRAGALESALQEWTGSWVDFPDSGSPDHAYDGTSGGAALTVEDHVVAADVLGVRGVWDGVAGALSSATVLGAPGGTVRAPDLADDPAGNLFGLTPTSAGNYVSGGIELPGDSEGTLVCYFTYNLGTEILTSPLTAGLAGIYTFTAPTYVHARIYNSDGTIAFQRNMTPAPTNGDRCALIVEYDDNTPGSGTGTANVQVWNCDTGVQISTHNATYLTALTDHLARLKAGVNLASSVFNTEPGLVINLVAGKVISNGRPEDIADGTDPSGGLTLIASLNGYRTGVFDSLNPTGLVQTDGAGDDVVAQ